MMVPAIAALYEHFFVSHKPIVKPDDFRPVLDSVLGKELAAKVAERSGDVGKKLLTENSEEAVSQGAFGLPWFVGECLRSGICPVCGPIAMGYLLMVSFSYE